MPMPKPKTEGRYLKAPKAGQSITFRVLADPLEFYVAFKTDEDKKQHPVRRASLSDFRPGDYDLTDKFGKASPKYCQAFPILGPTRDVMIAEFRQKTILDGLFALDNKPKWGDLRGYDVTVTGAEDGKSYTVTPEPKEPLTEDEQEKWDGLVRNGFNLRVLLNCDDPFKECGVSGGHEDGGPDFDSPDDRIPF